MSDPTYDDWPASWGPPPAARNPWQDAVPGRIEDLARPLAVVLGVGVVVDVVAVVTSLRRIDMLDRLVVDRFAVSREAIDRSDLVYRTVGIAQLLATLVTAALFVSWLWRAYDNASRRHAYPIRHSRGWVAGAWVVPFLNLVRPKQIVDDVWRASRVDRTAEPRVPGWVHGWWAAFLLGGSITGRALSGTGETETFAQLRTAVRFGLFSDVMNVVAGVLAILLVTGLSANQRTWLTDRRGWPRA